MGFGKVKEGAEMSTELEWLARVSLFNGLSLQQLRAVQGVLKKRTWAEGDTILREGEGGKLSTCLARVQYRSPKRCR